MTAEKNILEPFFKSLGQLITRYRKEKNFSLEELGFRIGQDRSSMHRIEKGKPITVATIVKLSLALDKEPKDFFDIDFDLGDQELETLIKLKKNPKKKTNPKKQSIIKKK